MAQNDVIIPATLGNLTEVHEGYRAAAVEKCLDDCPYAEKTERQKYLLWREGWWAFVDADIEAALKNYAEPWG
jgi:ribosome modulation factor